MPSLDGVRAGSLSVSSCTIMVFTDSVSPLLRFRDDLRGKSWGEVPSLGAEDTLHLTLGLGGREPLKGSDLSLPQWTPGLFCGKKGHRDLLVNYNRYTTQGPYLILDENPKCLECKATSWVRPAGPFMTQGQWDASTDTALVSSGPEVDSSAPSCSPSSSSSSVVPDSSLEDE